jgi:regulator of PEP synthase PpsR (kinase-PPPase family)
MKPPDKVFTVKTQKVGFTIEYERLVFIRQKRLKYTEAGDYVAPAHVRDELDYSRRIFSQVKGLQVIDVTQSSIEEVANKIIEARQEI